MLFGIAFNCHYIISLTHSKTKKSCILGYIANNLVIRNLSFKYEYVYLHILLVYLYFNIYLSIYIRIYLYYSFIHYSFIHYSFIHLSKFIILYLT